MLNALLLGCPVDSALVRKGVSAVLKMGFLSGLLGLLTGLSIRMLIGFFAIWWFAVFVQMCS